MTGDNQWRTPGPERYALAGNKECHPTKQAAKDHRAHVLGKKGKANGRTNVYRCDWCSQWHIGRR